MKTFAIIGATAMLAAGTSEARTVYFDDFEGPGAMAGAGGIEDAQGYDGVNGIEGSFWRNDSRSLFSTLSLTGLGPHDMMTLEFDIAFIDSWDGAIGRIFGDDFFNIVVDGVTRLVTTNFGGLGDELSDGVTGFFGFNPRYDDEAYRLTTTFAHNADSAEIAFFADGRRWQAGLDESWAIDNLRVSVSGETPSIVPAPGALPLMAGGIALLAFAGFARRRRG